MARFVRLVVLLCVSVVCAVALFVALAAAQRVVVDGGFVPDDASVYSLEGGRLDEACGAYAFSATVEDPTSCDVVVVRSLGAEVTSAANGVPLDRVLDHLMGSQQVQVFSLSAVRVEGSGPQAVDVVLEADVWRSSFGVYLGSQDAVFGSFFLLDRTLRTACLATLVVVLVYALSFYWHKRSETYLRPLIGYVAFLVVWLVWDGASATGALSWGPGALMQVCSHMYAAYIPSAICLLLSGVELPGCCRTLIGWPGLVGVPLLLGIIAHVTNFGIVMISTLVACLAITGGALVVGGARGNSGSAILVVGFGIAMGLKVAALLVDCGYLADGAVLYALRKTRLLNVPAVLSIMLYLNRLLACNFQRTEDLNAVLDAMARDRAQQLFEQQDMRLGMMVNIFHDLRGPLFSIRSGIGMLPTRTPEDATIVTMLRERVDVALRLVEDLFAAAKLEDGDCLMAQDAVDVGVMLEGVAAAFVSVAGEREITLDLTCDAGCRTWGDRDYLRRAFENLVANAIGHTSRGASVRIGARCLGGSVVVDVCNPGEVSPRERDRVFERYFHRGGAMASGSSGLGLSIVRSVVEQHGGTVTLSCTGGETCFEVRLPLLEGNEGER